MLLEDKYLDIHTLLFGDQSLGPQANKTISKNVHEYIRLTRHFCAWAIITFWCNIYDLNMKILI